MHIGTAEKSSEKTGDIDGNLVEKRGRVLNQILGISRSNVVPVHVGSLNIPFDDVLLLFWCLAREISDYNLYDLGKEGWSWHLLEDSQKYICYVQQILVETLLLIFNGGLSLHIYRSLSAQLRFFIKIPWKNVEHMVF